MSPPSLTPSRYQLAYLCGLARGRFWFCWFGLIRFDSVWFGLVRFDSVWFSLIRFDSSPKFGGSRAVTSRCFHFKVRYCLLLFFCRCWVGLISVKDVTTYPKLLSAAIKEIGASSHTKEKCLKQRIKAKETSGKYTHIKILQKTKIVTMTVTERLNSPRKIKAKIRYGKVQNFK